MPSRVREILQDLLAAIEEQEATVQECEVLRRLTVDRGPDPLLTVKQVSALLQTSQATTWELIRKGALLAVTVGEKCTRIRRSDYDRYIEECRRSG